MRNFFVRAALVLVTGLLSMLGFTVPAQAYTMVDQSTVTITSDAPSVLSGVARCRQFDSGPGVFGDYEVVAQVSNRTLPTGSHYRFDLYVKGQTVTPIATVENPGTQIASAIFDQYADGISKLPAYRVKVTQVTPGVPNPNVLVGWLTTTGQCGWADLSVVPYVDFAFVDANHALNVRVANDTAFARQFYLKVDTANDTGEILQLVSVGANAKVTVVGTPVTGPTDFVATTGALGGLNGPWTHTSSVVYTGIVPA